MTSGSYRAESSSPTGLCCTCVAATDCTRAPTSHTVGAVHQARATTAGAVHQARATTAAPAVQACVACHGYPTPAAAPHRSQRLNHYQRHYRHHYHHHCHHHYLHHHHHHHHHHHYHYHHPAHCQRGHPYACGHASGSEPAPPPAPRRPPRTLRGAACPWGVAMLPPVPMPPGLRVGCAPRRQRRHLVPTARQVSPMPHPPPPSAALWRRRQQQHRRHRHGNRRRCDPSGAATPTNRPAPPRHTTCTTPHPRCWRRMGGTPPHGAAHTHLTQACRGHAWLLLDRHRCYSGKQLACGRPTNSTVPPNQPQVAEARGRRGPLALLHIGQPQAPPPLPPAWHYK